MWARAPAWAAGGSGAGVGPAGKTKAASAPRARIGNQLRRIIESPDPYGAQPHRVGLPAAARGSESGQQRIPVIVEPRVKNGWPQIDEAQIEALGGRVDAVSRSWMRVHVAATDVERLATHPDIAVMRTPAVPIPVGMGAVESESVELTGAVHFHAGGIDGTGVRVAVVDAGFVGLNDSIAMGELPQDTTALDFSGLGVESETQHGVIVAEHLMDMAPGVDLTVIKVGDEVDVENAADYIRDNDIQLLNLSLGWVGQSYYDDTGPITSIFNELHDVDGVFCAVSAGNNGQGHWRGGWVDEDGDGVLEFAPGVEQITLIDPGMIVAVLNWNQYGNSETDLDIDLIATPNDGGEERVVMTGYGYGLLRLAIGEPPVATDDVAETEEDTAVNIAVLANDSDPDGHALTVGQVDDPLHGTAQIHGDQITYTPDADFYGEDVFIYHLVDTSGYGAPATIVVTVNPVQDGPRPVDDHAATTVGTPVTIDVLRNDEEPDGEALTITHVSAGGDGVTVSNGDGTVTYTPNQSFEGTDTFQYTVADPHGAAESATVDVWVSDYSPRDHSARGWARVGGLRRS